MHGGWEAHISSGQMFSEYSHEEPGYYERGGSECYSGPKLTCGHRRLPRGSTLEMTRDRKVGNEKTEFLVGHLQGSGLGKVRRAMWIHCTVFKGREGGRVEWRRLQIMKVLMSHDMKF